MRDAYWGPEGLVCTLSQDKTLTIHCFDPITGKEQFFSKIGEPAYLYFFPIASNICRIRGKFLFAWIDDNGLLRLSSWRPSPLARVKTLLKKHPVPWNTSLSIGGIENTVLVAWHQPSNRERTGATIKVASVKVD
jgi:hypothetical protein